MEIIQNEIIDDIGTPQSKENYDKMVDYLVSMPVNNYKDYISRLSVEKNIKHESGHFLFLLGESMQHLFLGENLKKAKDIIKYRSTIKDSEVIDGFAKIYELNNEKILLMEIDGSFVSVAATVHELTHLLQAINENNPSKKYNEILSIFSEFVVLDYFSSKFNNLDIFDNHLINRLVNRMSNRVCSNQLFSDEEKWIKEIYFSCYTYFLGTIYAIRLFDLYKKGDMTILSTFNSVLAGKITVDEMLEKYCINISNQDTFNSFINCCDYYRKIVDERYGSNVHYVR